MRYLALLAAMEIMFCAFGAWQVDDHVVRIEGPPPRESLPQMLSGAPGQRRAPMRLVIRNGASSPRTLIFEFHVPTGRQDNLDWEGHGLPFPASVPVLDDEERTVATMSPDSGGTVLASPDRPLVIPSAGALGLLRWVAARMWLPLVLALFLFAVHRRFAVPAGEEFRRAGWLRLRDRLWLLTLLSMTGPLLALLIPGALRFDVGDDPAMEMLASGYVTGHPSPHLVFSNVLYGFVFQALYTLMGGVAWYPLVQLALLLAALGGCTYLFLRVPRDAPATLWLGLLGLGFGSYLVSHLQFTSVAYLVGLLGLLLFCLLKSRSASISGVVFVVLCSLIRFDSFVLLLLTAGPAAWVISPRARSEKMIFILSVIALAAGAVAFDHAYSAQDPGWAQYREYNHLRGDLHMNPKFNFGPQNQATFAHVGWSTNDASMFDQWLYEDPVVFSPGNLAYLDQHLVSDRDSFSVLILFLAVLTVAPVPILIFATLALQRSGRLPPLLLAIVLLPVIVIFGYLTATARLPSRVAVPPLFASSLFLLLGTAKNPDTPSRPRHTAGLTLLVITLAYFSVRNLVVSAAENRAVTESLESNIRALAPADNRVIVASINAIPLEHLPPFTAVADMRRLDAIQLMWSGGSPALAQQLRNHGASSLFESLAHDPRFLLAVPTDEWTRAGFLTRFWQEHLHENTALVPATLPNGDRAIFSDFTLMQAVPAPDAPPP